jgi:hypothetical protein
MVIPVPTGIVTPAICRLAATDVSDVRFVGLKTSKYCPELAPAITLAALIV